MIELLGLGKEHGYDRLQEAVKSALATGCWDVAAVRYLLTVTVEPRVQLEIMDLGLLSRYERPLPVVNDYDQLLVAEVSR
jgi:hypothetical protein